jgi:uncharacterized protein (DUF58 family)
MHRLASIVAALVVVAAAGAVDATATTGTGNQNPDLFVRASVTPDQAATGQLVTATVVVRNKSTRRQTVTITASLASPYGQTYSYVRTQVLRRGQTVRETASRVVQASDPRGVYTLTVSARSNTGTSTASASVEYV